MPLICPKCGAENRETAKFCLKCAQQMVPLGGAEPEPPAPRRRKRRRSATGAEVASGPKERANRSRYALGGAAIVLMAAAFVWTISPGPRSGSAMPSAEVVKTSAAQTPASAAAPVAMPSSSARAAPAASTSVAAAVASDVPPLAASASAAAPSRALTPAPKSEPAARAPARTASKTATARPPMAPAPAAPVVEAPAPVAPTPAPPAPAPAATLCAGQAFIAHAVCLQTECNKPAMRQQAQCVRMREQQEALRRGSGDN